MCRYLLLFAAICATTIHTVARCEDERPPVFSDAQRLILAQEAFPALKQSGGLKLSPPFTGPTDLDGIKRLTAELCALEERKGKDTVAQARCAAFRKLFYSIGSGDGRDLRDFGVDFSADFWGEPTVAAVQRPGFSTPQRRIVGYKTVKKEVLAELLNQMATRQIFAERTKSFGGQLSPEDYMHPDGRQAIDGALIVNVDRRTGQSTTTPSAELKLETFADLGDLSLNPHNVFNSPDGSDRALLFDRCLAIVESGLDKNGEPLCPDDLKPAIKGWHEQVQAYMKLWDDLLNTSETAVGAIVANTRLGVSESANAALLLTDESALANTLNANIKSAYSNAAPAFRILTASRFGALPNAHALAAELHKKHQAEQSAR